MSINPMIPFPDDERPEDIARRSDEELAGIPDEQLKAHLAKLLRWDAVSLVAKARIIRELERRGIDFSGLKIGLLDYLRKIACNQLVPEVIVRFGGSLRLLNIVAKLPLDEQRRLAEGGTVRLLTFDAAGLKMHRNVPPLELQPAQLSQVFASGHIRTEVEQLTYLDAKRQKAHVQKRPDEEQVGKAVIDRIARIIKVGKYRFTFEEWDEIHRRR